MKPTHFTLKYLLLGAIMLLKTPQFAQKADSLNKRQSIRIAKIDVKHIVLDLQFDWKKRQAFGSATLTLTPLSITKEIALNAAKMAIKSVFFNNKPLKYDYDDSEKDDNLKIYLDRIYKTNENITLKIEYNTLWHNDPDPNTLGGSTGKGLRFFQPTFTEPRKRKQIWSMADFDANRYWFPCHDNPSDFRTTELKATVEKPLMVISNGNLIKTVENANGTRTFYWKMDTPYANYQTSIVVGEYIKITQNAYLKSEIANPKSPNTEGVTLHTYAYPDEVEATKASVIQLPEMLKFFEEKTGIKYPFAHYSQVFVQDLPWGMWNTGTSMLTENMVDDYGTHADFFYLWDDLEAEALASQWFGGIVTAKDWSENWLNRAFSRYFSELYDEYKNGRAEVLLYPRQWDLNTYLWDWNGGIKHPIVTQNFADKTAYVTDNYGIFKGALVLNMLHQHLGDAQWWRVINHYLKTNAHKAVTTEDFKKAVEYITKESYNWFFDQWVYKIGHPIFEVSKSYDADKKQLKLLVKQVQKPDSASIYPQNLYFQGKMAIQIDGKIEQIQIEPKEENSYIFNCPQLPKIVGFDYEGTWIKEVKFEKTLDELLNQFQNDSDILGRRWAMNELVKIAKKDTTTEGDKNRIYAAFRQVLESPIYWRFKFMALPQLQSLLAPTEPSNLDKATTNMLLNLIKNDKNWVQNAAITLLGTTHDAQYTDLYISKLNDKSDRIINAAAIALGKTKSPKAFDALVKLKDKPSWKNQSLISTLYAFSQLHDPRCVDIALNALKDSPAGARWTLATPIWDYRLAAAQTLVDLGKNTEGYPIVLERYKRAIEDNDLNDIFNNVLIISTLGDPRGQAVFDELKVKYKDNTTILNAVNQFEEQFKAKLK